MEYNEFMAEPKIFSKTGDAMFGKIKVVWYASDILCELLDKYNLDIKKELIIKEVTEELPNRRIQVERLKAACNQILASLDKKE